MPEDTIDFLLTTLDYTLEGFEYLLEELIQRVFHIDKQDSQVYVFYILIAVATGLVVLVLRKLPSILNKQKNDLSNYYLRKKQSVIFFGIK